MENIDKLTIENVHRFTFIMPKALLETLHLRLYMQFLYDHFIQPIIHLSQRKECRLEASSECKDVQTHTQKKQHYSKEDGYSLHDYRESWCRIIMPISQAEGCLAPPIFI